MVLSFFLMVQANAQTTVRGLVLSKSDMNPVPGATIIPNGKPNQGTTTDVHGKFSIKVEANTGSLTVSFIGMDSQTIPYGGGAELTILLEESLNDLDEVVMIGYGTSKRENLTSSVSSVTGVDQISSRPVANLNDFLQGNVPGVTVMQQGGDPSQEGLVVIRGYGSLADERPLTVVDGVPYYGPSINPNDIESVSILKDAAAAAIYGAQAASGVIVIKTKDGAFGKPKVTFDLYSGVQRATNLPTPLTAQQQANVYNLAADNAGVDRQAAHNADLNPWGQVNRTNWMDEIFRNAAIYSANVNVSGAGENANYMASFGYLDKDGLLQGTGFTRYNLRLKADFYLSDKVTVGENIYLSKSNAVGTNSSSSYSGSIISALYMPSAAPVYDENGAFHGVVPADLSQFAGTYGDVYNPMGLLLRPTVNNPVVNINTNTYLNYEIIPGLSFRSTFSYNVINTENKQFNPRIPELGRTNLQNYLYQSHSTTNRWIWDNQVSYQRIFGKHDLNVTAVYSSQYTKYDYYSQEGRGFSSEEPFNQYMGNASEFLTPQTSVYEDALTSAIGRAMYNYDERYFLTASVRRDETSRLARENQSSYFPSVSGAWNISNESFFQSKLINSLKVRASWGQIGNINSVGYYSFDVPLGTQTVVLGEGATLDYKAVYAGQQSNPALKWETSESTNFGLDASFLDDKLSLTMDYYIKTTKGMILPGLEDLHQGTSAADVNGGEVRNRGFEFSAGYFNNFGELRFGARGNFSMLHNELVNLDGYNKSNVDFISHTDNVRSTLAPYRSMVGQPLYATYLVPYLGIFQSQEEVDSHTQDGQLIQPNAQPGDFKFQDVNGDGRISDEDRIFMDSYLPDFTYGFNFTFDFKGFDASMILQGVSGVKVFNGYKFTALNASQSGYNLDNRVLDAWTPEHTNTDIPRISAKDDNLNFGTSSSWYLEDASYLRMKNLTIGYTFSETLLQGLAKDSSLRVYFSTENLFTITNYSGIDPEVGGKGLDVGRYPLPQTFTAGLSLSL
ncbi:SusC/RagA family TonB-linked outer membrane protein [Echinicola pacifica]|uniref:SusC/RagA family TonB-linked outer membrane protein n=2 Tax=Echinicola pacifica TaxID=346377 RepID=A0A918QCZ9_9BACT|nr:SusC/RagA family TonB-linked outer membrane protein [Echinicola pacifica]